MKNVLRSLMFVAILGSFGDYCIAAQAAAQPLQVSLIKRNGKLRRSFEALQALPPAKQDQAAIEKIKQDSNAYMQEAQSHLRNKTKRLVKKLNAEIMQEWSEPKKPGVFSRAGSWFRSAASATAQKTKNVAGAGLSTLGNGVTSTASKAWSGLNYRLFEKGEITRAQIALEARYKNLAAQQNPSNQEIQQLLADVDTLQKRATTWYNQPHMPIEELRVNVQSLAIPAPRTRVPQSRENVRELEQQDIFTVGQEPVAPAPLRIIVITDENGCSTRYKEPRNPAVPAHDAGNARPEPQAREITPPTSEEQKKQAEEIAAQAERERAKKESHEIPLTAATSSATSSSSASVAVPEAAPVFQEQSAATHAKELCDYFRSYYETAGNQGQQKSLFRTKILPVITDNLQQRAEILEAINHCVEEAKGKSLQKEIEKIFTSNKVYQREVNNTCSIVVCSYAIREKYSEETVKKELTKARAEALTLMCDYVHLIQRKALREEVAEKREPHEERAVSAAPKPQPAHPARTERSEALLKHLEALHEVDSHQQRKALHQGIIRYLEDQPAILNGITKCIGDNRHLPGNQIKQKLRENSEYQELERNCLIRYSRNPNLNAVCQEFINAAINSQETFVAHPPLRSSKTNWWFRGVGAAAATYGAYGLYNLYAGATKAMVGYNSMSWLGSLLPTTCSLTKAAAFKVILPAVGIAAAGVICYACYRLYVHKKLSDAVTAAKAQCENPDRTPQDREHLLQLTHQNLKEANTTMETGLTVGEVVGAVSGTNPIADAVQGALN